jgi:hypothetical protein
LERRICLVRKKMMDKTEIKRLINFLHDRVKIGSIEPEVTIIFNEPSESELTAEGFGDDIIAISLKADWWNDMVADIIETPGFVEPEASPEQILKYARDVVYEYIAKRLKP